VAAMLVWIGVRYLWTPPPNRGGEDLEGA